MPHCTNCGEEVLDGSRFCSNCGTELAPPSQTNTAGTGTIESPPAIPQSDRNMATLLHLSALAGLIVPFGNIFGPLTIWLLKRHESWFVDEHGKAAVNYQISVTIYFVICVVLAFLLIGIPLLIALAVFDLIVLIIAAIRANDGQLYRYPLTIGFIK